MTDSDWYAETYTYRDSGVIGGLSGDDALREIELARKQLTPDEFAQEYECSWEAALRGAVYARQVEAARYEGRFKRVPWESNVPVDTFWDLGYSDATAIIFAQKIGREIHVIDYLEGSRNSLEHYVRELTRKPYLYGGHYLPHDAGYAQLGLEGRSLADQAKGFGLRPIHLGGKSDVLAGITQARTTFSQCWFDQERCQRLIDVLSAYRMEWDDKKHDWKEKPYHDWASHGADAFRYLAMEYYEPMREARAWAIETAQPERRIAKSKTGFELDEFLHGRRR